MLRFTLNTTMILVSLTTVTYAADENICAAPLRAALMTVTQSGSASGSSEASTAWQCSFKFSNHDEAIAAGLNVGAVVYGVPLQIGGTFNKQNTDQWKEENCSNNTKNAAFEAASYSYLRQVAPGAMNAYVACIQATANKGALECTLTREPSALTIKWRRTDGELENAAPEVRRLMVTNGSCEPGIPKGAKVLEGGIGSPCKPEPKLDLMVMIETSRGICTGVAVYPKKVFSVVGTVSLEGDRTMTGDVVRFDPGSRILTNGRSLTIDAGEIDIGAGGGEIISFDGSGPPRAPGANGDSGGAVLVKTDRLTGEGDLRIDLKGQDGVPGIDGTAGATGPGGENARGRGLQGIRGCGGGNDASPGGKGGRGADGTPGGSGGNGGVIVVQVADGGVSLSRLVVVSKDGKTLPGKGAPGGAFGPGGPGGPGGSGDGGHQGCGGRPGADPGPKGDDGIKGADGADGKPGPITIQ